ncbi:hypothetical protein F5Y03DRAFT_378281 [Xylaria venustula]|nr:hypothetical protein F5Y03DRAFT_378281 [Xylaria venustula]
MSFTYERLNTEISDFKEAQLGAFTTPRNSGDRKWMSIRSILSVAKDVLLIATSIAAIVSLYKIHITPQPKSCSCGKTVAEARSMGCTYDSMAAAWLPAHCIDAELTAEFEVSGDGPDGKWQYFADKQRKREFTMTEVANLADQPGSLFWTSMEWHKAHCVFYWRKSQRAAARGVTVEARYDNERHVDHCALMFQDNVTMDAYSYVELNSDNTEPPEFLKNLSLDVA